MYKEIEFVCVNKRGGTSKRRQEALFRDLSAMRGVLVYRQDFSSEGDYEISMAAIILDRRKKTEAAVLKAAEARGVEVDLVNKVSERRIIQILHGTLPYLKDFGGLIGSS